MAIHKRIKNILQRWQYRNITGLYCADRQEAAEKILVAIPKSASVGISGSQTLGQLEIVKKLTSRGNKVFNQYRSGLSRQESFRLRRQGAQADYYLASANAISKDGELVFFSGYGQRITGISSAKNVIIVSGINKITANLSRAISRSREFSAPLNCQRLRWKTPCLKDGLCRKEICLFPGYKRMCCQILIIEAEIESGRLKVILVGESLGF